MVMRNGDVVETGDAEALFEAPKTDYARALLAAALDLKAG
jgi:microcin C transport system ATP-binding protein